MENPDRRSHKKKKKHRRHRSSESSSSSSSDSSVEHKRAKVDHHKEHRSHRDERRSHHKHESRGEHRKRDASPEPERNRHRDDRSRDEPSRSRGDRRDGPSGVRVKQEPKSDDESPPRRRGNERRGRGRGGSFRGGRGGRGGGIPWGRDSNNREDQYEWGQPEQRVKQEKVKVEKEKPNFGLSGKLTEECNTVNGVIVKYSEPPEARKPKRRWRLYVFKGQETLPTLYIHRQSAYLMGRDRKVADIPLDHPSVSKQHAALQYRLVTFKRADGMTTGKCIRPYIIDLESANGTYVNNEKLEPRKYVQIMEKDVLKFGYSSREYVLLHEHSQGDNSGDDDDVKDEGPNP